MAESLGNPERTALLALLLAGGEVSNPDLRKRYGVELRKDAREKLNRAGLITSRTEKTPHRHRITAEGRTRCEELLASGDRPAGASSYFALTCTVLALVVGRLRQQGVRLVDVINPLESLIRIAYRELSTKPQDWVRLAQLRPRLDGADRDEVDKALLAMTRTGLVHLAPDSDRKALTDADLDAAIRIGNEPKHLVAIEES